MRDGPLQANKFNYILLEVYDWYVISFLEETIVD